jgi:flagellar biosynthesis/type III secretory pathway protein FliH
MKYTVTINEKSKTITVNLNGYEGVAKCCATDTFNLQTGIELALERARVAEANAKKPKVTAKPMGVMELVKALEKALPKGQVVIVGNGNGLTAEHKKWLHSMTDCKGGGYTEDDLDKAYQEGYADGADECDCDCDNCDLCYTEDEYDKAYDKGYDEGYADGHSDGYDEGVEEGLDEDEVIEAVRNVLRQ